MPNNLTGEWYISYQSNSMRTFLNIIEDAGGPTALARRLQTSPERVKQWKHSASIPAWYWRRIVLTGVASFDELSLAAEKRSVAASASCP